MQIDKKDKTEKLDDKMNDIENQDININKSNEETNPDPTETKPTQDKDTTKTSDPTSKLTNDKEKDEPQSQPPQLLTFEKMEYMLIHIVHSGKPIQSKYALRIL